MDETAIRIEHDSEGEIEVPAEHYWGAQTQRSLAHYEIGGERFRWDPAAIRALGLVKRVAASVNADLGVLDLPAELIAHVIEAAREVEEGRVDAEFPLVVFQTGSGTHTNMNANEVIAARANELAGAGRGGRSPVHPNDHVNLGQSSNDIIPTALNVAVALLLRDVLAPAAGELVAAYQAQVAANAGVVKVGRTHLQDATPMTLGQEIGAWAARTSAALEQVTAAGESLLELPVGGTAVGTGLNTHPEFGARVCRGLADETGLAFRPAPSTFGALAGPDALVAVSAALRGLALVLHGVAGDVRLLSSGPRAGLAELVLPVGEPGSSIMPGKVNPSQAEALQMVAARVVGNDAALALSASQPGLQLYVGRPLAGHLVMESIRLLADGCRSFARHAAAGLEPNRERIAAHLAADLMLATALSPHLGYDATAEIVQEAVRTGAGLRDAALASGRLTAQEYDAWVDPLRMTAPTDPS